MVRVLKPTPIMYLVFEINGLFIYLNEQNVYIFLYSSLIFYTLLAICKQSSQINITILVSEHNIWAKKVVFSNRDVRKWDHLYINDEKLGQSYTIS